MREQRIVIEIDAEGRLTADSEGFSGDACIRDLEQLLEGIASSWEQVQRKPEAGEARLSRRSERTVTSGRKA
jgi:hypothetical protein